jgi:hypothetical protein
MSDQFWLTKARLERIEPFFPRMRGIRHVDDRRVVSEIVHVIRNGRGREFDLWLVMIAQATLAKPSCAKGSLNARHPSFASDAR